MEVVLAWYHAWWRRWLLTTCLLYCLSCAHNSSFADTLQCRELNITKHGMNPTQYLRMLKKVEREEYITEKSLLSWFGFWPKNSSASCIWFHLHAEIIQTIKFFPDFLEMAWYAWRAESDVSGLRLSRGLKGRFLNQSAIHEIMISQVLSVFKEWGSCERRHMANTRM